jgi:hypothetical protein
LWVRILMFLSVLLSSVWLSYRAPNCCYFQGAALFRAALTWHDRYCTDSTRTVARVSFRTPAWDRAPSASWLSSIWCQSKYWLDLCLKYSIKGAAKRNLNDLLKEIIKTLFKGNLNISFKSYLKCTLNNIAKRNLKASLKVHVKT